jgi:2-oxoglutarate ferredoxin oxidoreductase subunit gamma
MTGEQAMEQAAQGGAADAEHRLVIAGFGGQGILTLGKLLCMAAMNEGRTVTYLPVYGSEVRGGTANCQVVISNGLIYSPLVERADSLIILNQPSYEKFAPCLKPGGLLVVNSSAVEDPHLQDVVVLALPAADIAAQMGNVRVTNILMLGAFVEAARLVTEQSCRQALTELLGSRQAGLLELNLRAFGKGAELARADARTR